MTTAKQTQGAWNEAYDDSAKALNVKVIGAAAAPITTRIDAKSILSSVVDTDGTIRIVTVS